MTELWLSISPYLRELILLLGVCVAAYSVRSGRNIAKEKEALAMIMANKKDDELTSAIHKVAELHGDKESEIRKLAYDYEKLDEGDQAVRKQILFMLNHFEYVAVGIFSDIYCEKTIKRAQYTTITTMWKRVKPFVLELRGLKDTPTVYQELQKLAEEWMKKPLETRKSNDK